MGFQLWEEILLGRVLPSVTSTLSALAIVLLLIWLLRVRNPETRYLLLHLPLIKGLLVLIRGVPAPIPGTEGLFRFGVQILDPFQAIPMPSYAFDRLFDANTFYPLWDSDLVALALMVTLMAAAGSLLYRWVGLVIFYRRLLSGPGASRAYALELFRILDRLVPAFRVSYPRVVLAEELAIAPCTVGVRPATIVLSRKLLRELDEEKLEAVLAHELAHVARRDGILHWPSLLLRDLLSFNPVAHRIFDRLLVEREKDSDLRAAAAIGQPEAMARALVGVALLAKGASLRPAPGTMALRQSLIGRTAVVEERVNGLINGPVPASRLRPLGIVLLFLFLVLVRVFVHFPLAGLVVMLE